MDSTPAGSPGIFRSGKEVLWEQMSEDFPIDFCSEKFYKILENTYDKV